MEHKESAALVHVSSQALLGPISLMNYGVAPRSRCEVQIRLENLSIYKVCVLFGCQPRMESR